MLESDSCGMPNLFLFVLEGGWMFSDRQTVFEEIPSASVPLVLRLDFWGLDGAKALYVPKYILH